MEVWQVLLVLVGIGAIGGVINALITDNGFVIPKTEAGIIRPGFITNMVIGGFAAAASYGTYGPLGDAVMFGGTAASPQKYSLTVIAVITAAIIGLGGARWLTNEVDKKFLKVAAVTAAAQQGSADMATQMENATPVKAAQIALRMSGNRADDQAQKN